MVSSFLYVLASLVDSRMCSAGSASAIRIASASTATGAGRRATNALQRAAKPVSRSARSPVAPSPLPFPLPTLAGLTRPPILLSSAGIRVSAANIVKSTDSAAPMAGP